MSTPIVLRRGPMALVFLVVSMFPALAQFSVPAQGGGAAAAGPAIAPPPLPAPAPAPILPPPFPAQPAVQYYVGDNGVQSGPFGAADIQQRIAAQTINGQTLIWKSGTPAWVAANTFPEFQTALAQVPPKIPPDDAFRRLLVGTWQSQAPSPPGVNMTLRTTVTYTPDGNLTGFETFQLAGGMASSVPLAGTWSLAAVTDKSFTITAILQGGGTITVPLTVIDQNTLQNETDHTLAHRMN